MNLKYQINVMQAADKGFAIEKSEDGEIWYEDKAPIWDWNTYRYRIKGLTPYTPDNCPFHEDPKEVVGPDGTVFDVVCLGSYVQVTAKISFAHLLRSYCFTDGTPCGV